MLGILNCGRWYKTGKVDVLIMFSMFVFVLMISGCKKSGSEFHIPAEDKKCIDYTKSAIQARGEDYAKYTDKIMESGEAVWVAGKKFDFGFVRPSTSTFIAFFSNQYSRVDKQGRLYPGVSVTMKQDVGGMQKRNPGLIKTAPDPKAPHIVMQLKCKIGIAPSQEGKGVVEDVLPAALMRKDVSGYSIRLNERLGFYEINHIDKRKDSSVYLLKEDSGFVDLRFPRLICEAREYAGACSAKIVLWENIELHYSFPKAQLEDFVDIHKVTMGSVSLAYVKGVN